MPNLSWEFFYLPAKSTALSAKQFNGECGCSVCLHPGKQLSNNSRIYLPNTVYPDQTHSQILQAASEAVRSNTSVLGIYGQSPLANTVDFGQFYSIDYMHCVLEGVTNWLMNARV